MQQTRQNLIVGLFVLCGLIFLGALVVMFGRGPTVMLAGQGTPLHIHFASAAGIRPGNTVTVGGITVGRVLSVDFVDRQHFDKGVDVTALIDPEFQIPRQSRAVTTEPILGQGRPPIEIIPGGADQPPLPPDSFILGEVRGTVESILPREIIDTLEKTATHMGEAAANLSPVLKDLHEVLVKRGPVEVDRAGGPQGNLSSAMARFDALLKHVNDVLGDPDIRSKLKEAIENIHSISVEGKAAAADFRVASERMKVVVDDAQKLVAKTQSTMENLDGEIDARSRDLRDTLERGSKLLDSLHEITSAVNRGEGTIGKLARDAKLYDALVLTTERMGEAVEEFRLLVKEWQKGKVRVGL